MSLAAFVITYDRPTILLATLQEVLAQTVAPDHILVVDNGDPMRTKKVLDALDDERIEHKSLDENLGPAGATAIALRILATRDCDWIYWIDDDDPPQFHDTVEKLLDLACRVPDKKIGGVGTVGSRFDWSIGEMRRLPDDELHGLLSVDVIAGNQQLILNRQMVQDVGVADERLFFGLYEPEYCLRIRRAGYSLWVDGEFMHAHRAQAGRLNFQRRRAIVSDYGIHRLWQRYYRTRNYIFMMRKTFGRPDLARRETAKAFGRSAACWLRGPRYGAAFVPLQMRGVIDGYRSRLGRTVSPVAKYADSGSA